ncbi:kunitz trypsin inhibitor 5-like [Wolffia australiana]
MAKLILFTLSFILNCIATASGASPVVRDIAGKPLRRGVKYYILPVVRGRGGGVSLAPRLRQCPENVAQASSEVAAGMPVTFSPAVAAETIGVSADLNFRFLAAAACANSSVWRLGDFDDGVQRWFVTVGGAAGNPGVKTVSNWFKIEQSGKDYKLVFCPMVCNFCKVLCGDVGVFYQQGRRYLVLNGEPFPVMFKKA